MGMFDTVLFSCPKCKQTIEEQSKAGECTLRDYSSGSVPAVIAADIKNNYVYCKQCRVSFIIDVKEPSNRVELILRENNI